MNKLMFFSGLTLIGAELLIGLVYGLTLISWNWLTADFVMKAIGLSIFGILNIAGIVFLFVGAFSDNNQKGGKS